MTIIAAAFKLNPVVMRASASSLPLRVDDAVACAA